MDNNELIERYNLAKYILGISYNQLERYDGKTNQLLSFIWIDFTVLGAFATIVFTNKDVLTHLSKLAFLILIPIDLGLIIISLYVIKQTLSPHLKPMNKKPKVKNGLLFFVDIDTAFTKEEYVDILIGKRALTRSSRYDLDSPDAFYKCVIEDCAYDIYEQAEILQAKSRLIKKSYAWVFAATIILFLSIILLLVFSFVGL